MFLPKLRCFSLTHTLSVFSAWSASVLRAVWPLVMAPSLLVISAYTLPLSLTTFLPSPFLLGLIYHLPFLVCVCVCARVPRASLIAVDFLHLFSSPFPPLRLVFFSRVSVCSLGGLTNFLSSYFCRCYSHIRTCLWISTHAHKGRAVTQRPTFSAVHRGGKIRSRGLPRAHPDFVCS